MHQNNVNYFEYIDNFSNYSNVISKLEYGNHQLEVPIISILIPTYKRDNLLNDTLKSCIGQLSNINFEIIIVDNDINQNNIVDVIKLYDSDKIIYYKNQQNIGMFGNCNRAFELAKSEWVILLHDDDVLSPYFLNICLPLLKDTSIACIKPDSTKFSTQIPVFKEPTNIKLRKLNLFDFIFSCPIGAPSGIIYNRKKVIELGGFNPTYFPTTDYVFAARCTKLFNVYRIQAILSGYRVLENESLNCETMKLYYKNRYYISSYIMKYLGFGYKTILQIQAAIVPKITLQTNSFYNVDCQFDNEDLGLTNNNKMKQSIILMSLTIFNYILAANNKARIFISKIKTSN